MDLDGLHNLITKARWFTRAGNTSHGHLPLQSVRDSFDWDWLPTSRDQDDPIHGDSLLKHRESELECAKLVMVSLRTVSDSVPALTDGPNDFTNAAKGGAQFAGRMAAREMCNNACGKWCMVVELYSRGWWPCGRRRRGSPG